MANAGSPGAFAPPRTLMQRPKVRGIAAFLRLERGSYKKQVREALDMLLAARDAFADANYLTQTVRVATQPFTDYTRGMSPHDALAFLREFDLFLTEESKRIGIYIDPNIGPAMMQDDDDPAAVELLTELLSGKVEMKSSIHIAGKKGVHWKAVRAAARLVKNISERSPHSCGTFNFGVTALLPPYAPFFPGGYHDGPGKQFSVGLQSAILVRRAFEGTVGDPQMALQRLSEILSENAHAVEEVGEKVAKKTGWHYVGHDPTPAPYANDTVGEAIEMFTGAPFGSSGTMTAAAIITQAVRSVPVKQVGYSGLMLPVLEDGCIAKRWSERTCGIDSLMSYSAVCGTGLDTVPLPGDVTEEQLGRIYGDVATLAVKWQKPLTARLQPVAGRHAGERSYFGDNPHIVEAMLQPLP